jgi:hypothetical protein
LKFTPNTPFVSKAPTVVVDAGMAPGLYRFRLEVEDEAGNKSRPDERVVVILPRVVVGGTDITGIPDILGRPNIVFPTKQADRSPASERRDAAATEATEASEGGGDDTDFWPHGEVRPRRE